MTWDKDCGGEGSKAGNTVTWQWNDVRMVRRTPSPPMRSWPWSRILQKSGERSLEGALEHSSERTAEGAACRKQNRDAKCPGNVNKLTHLDPWQQQTEMDQTHQLGNRWAHWIWVSHLCPALRISQHGAGEQKDRGQMQSTKTWLI